MADLEHPDAVWTDEDLAATAAVMRRHFGLVFGPSRIPSAEDAMRRVMRELRLTSAARLRDAAEHSAEVQEALVAELTIGETYFFREGGQLDFVRRELLPAWAVEPLPLRVWSAGCSTGEEPYSLAILLREEGWTHGASILGTDLVPARLAHARRGRYGKWSMRGVREDVLSRWFTQQGRAYVLDPSIRAAVDFRVLDLACDDYALVAGATAMDLIFCRNVLIYFDVAAVREIARRLLAALSPRGWLFLSASDPVLSDLVECEAVATGAGYAYRAAVPELAPSALVGRPQASPAGRPPAPPAGRPRAPRAGRRVALRHTSAEGADDQREKRADDQRPKDADDRAEGALVARVRDLANRGLLRQAGEACAAALDAHPLSARLATLHATLLLQASRPAEAAAAARRSLYLDRRAPVAHLVLGDALARAGDPAGSARAFANAAELLAALPPDAPIEDADGEPAGRLAAMARHRAAARGTP